jgi:hypothetical protein
MVRTVSLRSTTNELRVASDAMGDSVHPVVMASFLLTTDYTDGHR